MNPLMTAIEKQLTRLQGTKDPLVSHLATSLANSLKRAGDPYPSSISDPDYREITEIISTLVEKHLEQKKSPALILDALLEIDTALMAEAQTTKPIATLFAPMAAERALQAAGEQQAELVAEELAFQSPIFMFDKRTLCAAPVGALTEEGLAKFIDRIIVQASREKPKNVLLVQNGLTGPPATERHFSTLKDELASMKTRLEIR